MQQQSKTAGHRERIAAQNAAIVRRNMPQVIYPPTTQVAMRHSVQSRPVFVQYSSLTSRDCQRLLTMMCRQGR